MSGAPCQAWGHARSQLDGTADQWQAQILEVLTRYSYDESEQE